MALPMSAETLGQVSYLLMLVSPKKAAEWAPLSQLQRGPGKLAL